MDADQLKHIFFPHTAAQTKVVQTSGRRFAYYTTAATAHSIIRNSEFWMRNTSTMNDYLEVEHGFDCLNGAIKSKEGIALFATIDNVFPGLSQRALDQFNGWLPHFRAETYITCFSEHLDHEDSNGRLSMWRAYGGSNGVALVVKPDVMLKPADWGIYASPVAYWKQNQVQQEMVLIAERIREYAALVARADPVVIQSVFFNMFKFAVLCTKHPGFAEEREWRLVTWPTYKASPLLQQTVEVVRGTPQLIQRIRMRDVPKHGVEGVTLAAVLERIIIGPCEYPASTYKAMVQLLAEAGFKDPHSVVQVSDIPLRVPNA